MDFSTETSLSVLRDAAQALQDQALALQEKILRLEAENARLKEQLERRQKALFGRGSERREARGSVREPGAKQVGHGPREQAALEQVTIVHELPESERVCPCCGGELVPLGSEVEASELVSVSARSFTLERHERQKYRCACNGHVATAPGPLRLVPGGRYSPAFAVDVAVGKYADHLPLERQARIMGRDGLQVTAATLWDQVDAAATLLEPVGEAIAEEVRHHPVLGADETRWPLLANGKEKENKLYQTWVLASPLAVHYRILDSRSKAAARAVLGDYGGVVVADGYAAYTALAAETGFTVANCWAHVRRKFVECEKNNPEEAATALEFISRLYAVERETPGLSARQTESAAVVAEFFAWCRKVQPGILPRSGLGLALAYALEREEGLSRFLEDARIPLDNNASERALRGVVLGRKNHYGSRSRRGTEVAALFYTLLENAKLLDLSPKAYLNAALEAALQEPGRVLTPAAYQAQLQAAAS